MFFYGLLCFYSFHDTSAKLSYTLPRVQPHAHTHPVMTRRFLKKRLSVEPRTEIAFLLLRFSPRPAVARAKPKHPQLAGL